MPVVYETNADIPSFGGINTTGDGYNMSLRLARDMMNVDCSNGGFTQFREGKEMPQHLNEPIETLEILHRRWGLREDGIVHEKPDWLVAVAGGKVYTKELDGDDEWTLRYEGLQESKCSCVAYEVNDFPPFVVGELVARVGDDNKSLIATMPEVSGGSGEYKLNYILQKISGSVVGDVIGGAYITDEVTLLSLENGLYRVKLVASDGTSEETRYSSSFVLSGYGAYGSLRVEVGEAYLDNDNVTIVCPKPTVTGGYPETPGGYTYSYTIYDSNGACVAYFYSDDDLIYVRTPYNGHFIIHVSVSDGKSTVTEDYGWFEVNAHQQLTEINVGYLEAQLLDNKKGFIIKRPEAGGGSGVYRYLYSLNRIEGEKAV